MFFPPSHPFLPCFFCFYGPAFFPPPPLLNFRQAPSSDLPPHLPPTNDNAGGRSCSLTRPECAPLELLFFSFLSRSFILPFFSPRDKRKDDPPFQCTQLGHSGASPFKDFPSSSSFFVMEHEGAVASSFSSEMELRLIPSSSLTGRRHGDMMNYSPAGLPAMIVCETLLPASEVNGDGLRDRAPSLLPSQ